MAIKPDALEQHAAAQLEVEIIPGTEVMRDVNNIHFAHAGCSEKGSILVPHPSNDPKGVNVITLVFANILIVPLSDVFGRRPISITFGILVILSNIWQALATSHESFLASRACNGLVTATSETIMVQLIADMHVNHLS
ncbi:hypothetical protein LTR37_019525 [Vermiconidia calcicola]|uniref:Uncharacterized protein n=1 Tax=Vermiconidia calcicola TaxID=1690605 RepID=A0ACC3MFE9_9PEZI|nr:hypothetical protein LTR37_019525 [Vermiconidia calcicola]